MPANTALFINATGGMNQLRNQIKEGPLNDWSLLKKIPADFNKLFSNSKLFENQPMALGLMRSKRDELDFLYLIDQRAVGMDLEKDLNLLNPSLEKYNYENESVYELTFKDKSTYSYASFKNLIIVAPYSLMVEDAISQLKSVSTNLYKTELASLINENSSSKGLQLFVNSAQLPVLLHPFLKVKNRAGFTSFMEKSAWLKMHFNKGENAFRLSSNILVNDANSIFTSFKKYNKITEKKMIEILPNNTAVLQWMGVDWESIPVITPWLDNYIKPWAGEEVAFLVTEPFSNTTTDEQFFIVKNNKPEKAKNLLKMMRSDTPVYTYNTYDIFQIKEADFIIPTTEKNLKKTFYTSIGNYVVFSKTRGPLEVWIDKMIVGQTLSNEVTYLQAAADLPSKAKGLLYTHPNYAMNLVAHYFEDKNSVVNEGINRMPNLGPIVMNVDVDNQSLKGNGFMGITEQSDNQAGVSWKTALRADAAIAPSLVNFSKRGKSFIFIQDENHTIYLLDSGGNIKWVRTLDSKILSEIHTIDYYQDGTSFLFFNTANKIYLIKENGEDGQSYPIDLQSPATNGMAVIDFDKRGSYEIFIGTENGNIYGYDQRGRPLPGWNPNFNKGIIRQPFKHFQNEGKDYIVSLNNKNRVQVFKRNGELRFDPIPLQGRFNSNIDIDTKGPTPRIIATSTTGDAFAINIWGKFFKLNVSTGNSEKIKFAYADVTGDERKDFIALDGTSTSTYFYEDTKFGKFSDYQFENPQDLVFAVKGKGGKSQIGTLCLDKKQINLLDEKGQLQKDFPLAGTTPFIMADLFADNTNTIIVANRASVYAYVIR